MMTKFDKNSWTDLNDWSISAAFKRRYGVNISMSLRQGDFLHSSELYRKAGLRELRYMNRSQIKHRYVTWWSAPNHWHISTNHLPISISTLSVRNHFCRLATYYKFIFVRDPFTRLLSAWKDKFLREDISGTRRVFGPKIIRKYRLFENSSSVYCYQKYKKKAYSAHKLGICNRDISFANFSKKNAWNQQKRSMEGSLRVCRLNIVGGFLAADAPW